jgi:hypothetical protein
MELCDEFEASYGGTIERLSDCLGVEPGAGGPNIS